MKKTIRNQMQAAAVGVVLVGAAIGVAAHRAPAGHPLASASAAPTPAPVLTVTTRSAEYRTMARTLHVTGTVYAQDELSIGAEATGLRIDQVLVEERDRVKKGQTLAILDGSVLQAQLEQTQARLQGALAAASKARQPNRPQDLATLQAAVNAAQATTTQQEASVLQARATLENDARIAARDVDLERQGFITVQDKENATTQVTRDKAQVAMGVQQVRQAQAAAAQSESRLQMAQIGGMRQDIDIANASTLELQGEIHQLQAQLAQTRIVAPDDGLIIKRDAHIGDISGGKSLFTMVRQNQLELRAQVPQADLACLQANDRVDVQGQGKHTTGRIWQITPQVDASTRQGIARILLPVSSGYLPGMFAQGVVDEGHRQVLSVPLSAVQGSSTQHFVFIYDDGVARRRNVSLGQSTGGDVEIVSGVGVGMPIIVTGAAFLNDRDAVAVSPVPHPALGAEAPDSRS